jgi:hypothetical protein
MVRFKSWRPALFLVAFAAAVLWTAPAMAAVKSTVTIASGEGAEFTGRVASPKQRCRSGRTVKLFREDDSGSGGELEGTARTDRMGLWMMDGSFLAGVYYARVLPALFHLNGMTIRCAGDISIRQHF